MAASAASCCRPASTTSSSTRARTAPPSPRTHPEDFDVDAAALDDDALRAAVDRAFAPEALTASVLVIHRGRVIAERYGAGAGRDTMLASWSMGKSIAALVIGRLIQEGRLELEADAPIPEWHAAPEDGRRRPPPTSCG